MALSTQLPQIDYSTAISNFNRIQKAVKEKLDYLESDSTWTKEPEGVAQVGFTDLAALTQATGISIRPQLTADMFQKSE